MLYTPSYNAYLIGTIVEHRTPGIRAQLHIRSQAHIINTNDDAHQHKGKHKQRWKYHPHQQ